MSQARIIKPGDEIRKDEADEIAYTFDASKWLGELAEIASGEVEVLNEDGSAVPDDDADPLDATEGDIADDGKSQDVLVSGGTADRKYRLNYTFTTDEDPAQIKRVFVTFVVRQAKLT